MLRKIVLDLPAMGRFKNGAGKKSFFFFFFFFFFFW